mmetsp:Transcript_6481/g.10074  ORF Transcript_6481/g.10074 Transcript_6481/m.10074 type:complete len:230 (-) Transcript_6481:256-945(-)
MPLLLLLFRCQGYPRRLQYVEPPLHTANPLQYPHLHHHLNLHPGTTKGAVIPAQQDNWSSDLTTLRPRKISAGRFSPIYWPHISQSVLPRRQHYHRPIIRDVDPKAARRPLSQSRPGGRCPLVTADVTGRVTGHRRSDGGAGRRNMVQVKSQVKFPLGSAGLLRSNPRPIRIEHRQRSRRRRPWLSKSYLARRSRAGVTGHSDTNGLRSVEVLSGLRCRTRWTRTQRPG